MPHQRPVHFKTLASRLSFGYLMLIPLMLVQALYVSFSFIGIADQYGRILDVTVSANQIDSAITKYTLTIVQNLALSRDLVFQNALKVQVSTGRAMTNIKNQINADNPGATTLVGIKGLLDSYFGLLRSISKDEALTMAGITGRYDEARKLADFIDEEIKKFVSLQLDEYDRMKERLTAQQRNASVICSLLILATMGLSVLLAWSTARLIRRDLSHIIAASREMSGGNYGTRISGIRSAGELIAVSTVFNEMAERVSKSFAEVDYLKGYLSDIIESMPSPLIAIDTENRITEWNQDASRVMGIPATEAIGQEVWILVPQLEQFRADIAEVRRSGQPSSARRGSFSSAPERSFQVSIFPLRTGQPHGLVIRFDDITVITELTRNLQAREEALERLNQELEMRVDARTSELTHTNAALKHSIETLELAQNQLIQAEKMAALGGLVAGVAHELNTPVGVCVTAASFLNVKSIELMQACAGGNLNKSEFISFMEIMRETSDIIQKNLDRIAEEVRVFKQVAVDQTDDIRRRFKLKAYMQDLLLSLSPQFKKTSHQVHIDCPPEIELFQYPGAISQIVTNMLTNSLIHGFEGRENGQINIVIRQDGPLLEMEYSDNGHGMPAEVCQRIFEPFYTTKRGQGGTGLGLYIVYNLITQRLDGSITCESALDAGTRFHIRFPLENQQESSVPGITASHPYRSI